MGLALVLAASRLLHLIGLFGGQVASAPLDWFVVGISRAATTCCFTLVDQNLLQLLLSLRLRLLLVVTSFAQGESDATRLLIDGGAKFLIRQRFGVHASLGGCNSLELLWMGQGMS